MIALLDKLEAGHVDAIDDAFPRLPPKAWTFEELATQLKLSTRSIQRLVKAGKIKTTPVSKRRIPDSEARRVITECASLES